MFENIAYSFPVAIAAVVLMPSIVILLIALKIAGRSVALGFVLMALWLRYMASEFPSYTFQSYGGFSINAMISIATVGVGAALFRWRRLSAWWSWAIYACIACALLSGAINQAVGGSIETATRWLYLIVMIGGVIKACEEAGVQRAMFSIGMMVSTPLMFQAAAVAVGVAKASEEDGSSSFIGGYNHEAAFSIVSLTFVAVVALAPHLGRIRRVAFLGAGLMSLVLANYRTSLAAVLPLLGAVALTSIGRNVRPDQRSLILVLTAPVMVGCALVASEFYERFSELGVVAESLNRLIAPPDLYSRADRLLLSSRPYIWSQYLSAYFRGDDLQLLLGFGPNSWTSNFTVYAHNSVVSALYETGLLGALTLISIWVVMLGAATRIRNAQVRLLILSLHVAYALLNMATMPHWSIEGMILYAIISGVTVHAVRVSVGAPGRVESRPFERALVQT